MKTSIDRLGRVVVPKAIRDELQLGGGAPLDIEQRDGVIVLRPLAAEVEIVETPDGPVIAPREGLPPLTDEQVRDVLEQVRR
jgi:AbrB family looped-hinge helix DNA binding protein